MKTGNVTLDILRDVHAIMTDDHFVYTSGKHGSVYIRKDRLYPHTERTSKICRMIAKKVVDMPIDVVVGPSICGILLSQWVAYHLSRMKKKEVLSVFTEKEHGGDAEVFNKPQVFKREYDAIVKGKNVLVVEDLTTTGSSVKKVVDAVRNAGGTVVCVFVMVNRNPDGVNDALFNAPFKSLAVLSADAYEESVCPLCKNNVPINTVVGHGKEYLERKKETV